MAEQSFPFENIDTTESQFSEWATNFQETGVQGSPTGTELGITVTGSDLNLTIAAGQAFIRGHYYINTSDLVLAVPSAGVNTRIDIVVVELDPEANTIVTKIVSGEAVSADPVAPTLTQSATGIYQLPISTLTIPTSTVAITAGMLVDTRTFMGNRIGIWTTATRPANPTAYQTLGYNTTIESHESWNGTGWVGFFDPISTAGDLVVGDGTGQASRLGIGTDDQVFTVVSGEPVWADVASVVSVTGVGGSFVVDAGQSKGTYNITGLSDQDYTLGGYGNGWFVTDENGQHYTNVKPLTEFDASKPDEFFANPSAGTSGELTITGAAPSQRQGGIWDGGSPPAPDGGSISNLVGYDAGSDNYFGMYYDSGNKLSVSTDGGLTFPTALISSPGNQREDEVIGDSSISNLVYYSIDDYVTDYYTSSNAGLSWTSRSFPSVNNINRIIWDGSKFIATGHTSSGYTRYIHTSTDGVSWTQRHSVSNSSYFMRQHTLVWNELTGANSKFVCMVQNSNSASFNGLQIYSVDGGITWTDTNRISSDVNFLDGNNGFFIVGKGKGDNDTTNCYMTTDPSQGWSQQEVAPISALKFGANASALSREVRTNKVIKFANGLAVEIEGDTYIGGWIGCNSRWYTEDGLNFTLLYNTTRSDPLESDARPFVADGFMYFSDSRVGVSLTDFYVYNNWVLWSNNPSFALKN